MNTKIELSLNIAGFASGLKDALNLGQNFQTQLQNLFKGIQTKVDTKPFDNAINKMLSGTDDVKIDADADPAIKSVNKVNSKLKQIPKKKSTVLTVKTEGFLSKLRDLSIVGSSLTSTLSGLINKAIGASESFAEFEQGLASVNSLANKSAYEVSVLGKSVLNMSNNLALSTSDLNKASYDAVSAGVEFEKTAGFVDVAGKAAVAGVTNVSTSVDGLTSVMNAYNIDFEKADEVSDMFFETVRRGKTTFNELASSIANVTPTAAAAEVPFEQVGAAMATMTKQGINSTVSTTYLRNGILALNKVLGDGWSKTMTLQGAMLELEKRVNGSQKDLRALVGSQEAYAAAVALTGKNAITAAQDLKALQNANGSMQQAYEIQSNTLAHQYAKLKTQIGNISIVLGQNLLPMVNSVFGVFMNFYRFMTETSLEKAIRELKELGASAETLAGLENVEMSLRFYKITKELREGGNLAKDTDTLKKEIKDLRAELNENTAATLPLAEAVGKAELKGFGNDFKEATKVYGFSGAITIEQAEAENALDKTVAEGIKKAKEIKNKEHIISLLKEQTILQELLNQAKNKTTNDDDVSTEDKPTTKNDDDSTDTKIQAKKQELTQIYELEQAANEKAKLAGSELLQHNLNLAKNQKTAILSKNSKMTDELKKSIQSIATLEHELNQAKIAEKKQKFNTDIAYFSNLKKLGLKSNADLKKIVNEYVTWTKKTYEKDTEEYRHAINLKRNLELSLAKDKANFVRSINSLDKTKDNTEAEFLNKIKKLNKYFDITEKAYLVHFHKIVKWKESKDDESTEKKLKNAYTYQQKLFKLDVSNLEKRKKAQEAYFEWLKKKYGEVSVEYLNAVKQGAKVDEEVQTKKENDKEKRIREWKEEHKKSMSFINSTVALFSAGFSTAFSMIVSGSKNIKQVLHASWLSIKNSFANSVSQMVAEWVKASLIKMAMSTTTESVLKANIAQTAAVEKVSLLQTIALRTKASLAAMGTAVANGFTWLVSTLGPFGLAAGLALGAGLIAAFKGLTKGFASGGYTGTGSKHEVAGVVHKGEVVFESEITQKNKGHLLWLRQKMQQGYSLPQLLPSAGSLALVANHSGNYASGGLVGSNNNLELLLKSVVQELKNVKRTINFKNSSTTVNVQNRSKVDVYNENENAEKAYKRVYR